ETERDQPEDTRIAFRIGLHLGDLIVDGDDLYGDGVNVAARLEAEAPAGGIVISSSVHDAVAGRLKAFADDLGNLTLKNIERPIRAFSIRWEAADWPVSASDEPAPASSIPSPADARLALPDKPSIAVLPFQNMSGDPEQEYFADGMVEDIVTALFRFQSLFVIARNSSFTYKGKAVDIKQVGRELGVRYVLEGSVRKVGRRVRITAQLIEASSGMHLWADKFDGGLDDLFELQDDVATRVTGAIAPRLKAASLNDIRKRTPETWDAYDHYLRGLSLLHYHQTPDAVRQALLEFRLAIGLSPGFGIAYAQAATCIYYLRNVLNEKVSEEDRKEALELAARGLELAG
ncbi:MAG: adenylate/guanylate cyclase domain-containing protein, partial [Bradyrhizobium sp.]|nr:adenylate/guanylate cyclase domain-containing protein [Bradyrhizobium sp.]